jgi:hypothetical protein
MLEVPEDGDEFRGELLRTTLDGEPAAKVSRRERQLRLALFSRFFCVRRRNSRRILRDGSPPASRAAHCGGPPFVIAMPARF